MTYTIKIEDTNSDLAKKLLEFLQSLAQTEEYNFLQIVEGDETVLSDAQKEELDKRYQHFLKHHSEYPEWDDVKQKYLQK